MVYVNIHIHFIIRIFIYIMIGSGSRDLFDKRDDIREYLYVTITIYRQCYINA